MAVLGAVLVLAVTVAGIAGLTVAFKAALGRSPPPLAQAVAAADGYGFRPDVLRRLPRCAASPPGCHRRMRSWPGRVAVWAAGAMLAALVGISRVYLGVRWTTEVLGNGISILGITVVFTG